jgi:hypothetical protein
MTFAQAATLVAAAAEKSPEHPPQIRTRRFAAASDCR